MAKPAPKPVSKAQGAQAAKTAWMADPSYQAQRGALKSQLGQYDVNLASQANRYDQQYGEDLGNLGLQNAQGARFVNPDKAQWTHNETLQTKNGQDAFGGGIQQHGDVSKQFGNWNQIDPMTSSGKAFTDQGNDYAARGMLQSTGFLTDHANLGQSFNNQLHDAQNSRSNYIGDLGAQNQAYVGQSNDNLNQARLTAMNTYSTQQQQNAVRASIKK